MHKHPLILLLDEDQENIILFREKQIDSRRLIELNNIISNKFQTYINENGFPYKNQNEEDVYKAAIALSLHSDKAFLEYIYNLTRDRSEDEIEDKYKAYFIDRLLVMDNKPQIYGTQFDESTGKLFPIEDKAKVNARRLEVGLSELEEKGI